MSRMTVKNGSRREAYRAYQDAQGSWARQNQFSQQVLERGHEPALLCSRDTKDQHR